MLRRCRSCSLYSVHRRLGLVLVHGDPAARASCLRRTAPAALLTTVCRSPLAVIEVLEGDGGLRLGELGEWRWW